MIKYIFYQLDSKKALRFKRQVEFIEVVAIFILRVSVFSLYISV